MDSGRARLAERATKDTSLVKGGQPLQHQWLGDGADQSGGAIQGTEHGARHSNMRP